ncbi:hypothetical protein [Streptomyces clavuligerus]|uniref:hypothetical protein n=3 Tax=Streptomyces clavuligerus TaxID=1901 RepID=UPI0002F2A7D1|nr:hypothetical protein [Streptomyces clavuligerus]WDN55081.1 hypothetical protein LL058_26355 [Streptomyces clavuligerus]
MYLRTLLLRAFPRTTPRQDRRPPVSSVSSLSTCRSDAGAGRGAPVRTGSLPCPPPAVPEEGHSHRCGTRLSPVAARTLPLTAATVLGVLPLPDPVALVADCEGEDEDENPVPDIDEGEACPFCGRWLCSCEPWNGD